MQKRLLIPLSILLLFIFPLISANRIDTTIFVRNYISNIDQFPDYEFILSVQYTPEGIRLEIINQSLIPVWEIGGSPLFGSVYAIKKSDSPYNWEQGNWVRVSDILNLEDLGAKKVISNLELYKDAGLFETNTTHYYTVDLSVTKNKPDRIEMQTTYNRILNRAISIFFLTFPLWILAIILLIVFLATRKKRKK